VRVVYTSDLHVDAGPRNAALVEHLAAEAAALRPDVLVIAGDVADTATGVRAGLQPFRSVAALRLFVPGNHDLYVEGASGLARGETSREKYADVLPAVAAEAGFTSLGVEPVWCGEVAIVGTPGWSDYSLRDPGLDYCVHPDHYRRGVWRTQRAFDSGHVLWPRPGAHTAAGAQPANVGAAWADDDWLCEHFLAAFDAALVQARAARALLAVVHVLPCTALVQRGAFAPSAFHDAYLGSTRFGARLLQEPRLRAVVTGHLHRPAEIDWQGVRLVARPVGRVREADGDLGLRARTALGCFEID
jgi:hypothetical protein